MTKSDAQLQEQIQHELRCDPHVEAPHVGVEVEHGVVTLTGTAASWTTKCAAERAAFRIEGVTDVANDIRIQPIARVSRTDTDIAAAVRRALQWNMLVPDERIRASVWDGIVTLTGTVQSTTERDDAGHTIAGLPGVRAVHNELAIEPALAAQAALR